MAQAGQMPNRVTFLSVMQAHSRAGRPHDVERLLSEMLARRVWPDERCVNALVLANKHAPPEGRMDPTQVAALLQQLAQRGFPSALAASELEKLGAGPPD